MECCTRFVARTTFCVIFVSILKLAVLICSATATVGSNAESLTPEEGPPRGTSRARSDLSRRIEASRAKAPVSP